MIEEFNIDDVLANVPKEGEAQPAIEDESSEEQKENETPTESPTETNEESESPANEGDPEEDNYSFDPKKGFHNHPAWQKRERRWNERLEMLEREKQHWQSMAEKTLSAVPQQANQSVPDRWKKLLGDNPEAFDIWRQEQEAWKQEVLQTIQQQQEASKQAETEALKQSESYVKDALDELEDQGLDFDRNELIKFALDYNEKYGSLPVDQNNFIDFHKVYDLFNLINANKSETTNVKANARKRIADFTTSDKRMSEPEEKPFLTSKDFRGQDWDTII